MVYGKSHMSPAMTSLWVNMRFSRLHCVLLLLLVSSLGFSSSQSFPTGVGESANDGCLCHGGASNSTNSYLVGLPTSFESNETFHLTLVVESDVAIQTNSSQGGFRLLVSAGEIEFANVNHTQEHEDGWTHTGEGNAQRAWNFTWISPQDNTSSVEFIVFGNAVNGNGNPMGDAWNSYGVTIPGSSFEGTLIQPDVDQSYSLTDFSLILGGLIAILVCFYIVVK